MTAPYYKDESVTLHHGDCLDVLRELPDNSVDAVVTDPPYNLTGGKNGGTGEASVNLKSPYGRSRIGTGNGSGGFMGQRWDDYDDHPGGFQGWCTAWATECLRILKPGGHLLAFGGSRTWHRLSSGIEDAGFEIRDSIAWLYGSGFPKSMDVSKAIDRAAGAERARYARPAFGGTFSDDGGTTYGTALDNTAVTEAAKQWQGWGTALKPAFEPIVVARKPLVGTVAQNVLEYGTGALNIDACRIQAGQDYRDKCASVVGLDSNRNGAAYGEWTGERADSAHTDGRWPTNVALEESQAEVLDQQSGTSTSRVGKPRVASSGAGWGMTATGAEYGDTGGASRFFPTFRYEAKAPTSQRPNADGVQHPTVKPLDLMRWLVRLVTPVGAVVLEPFAGSGTTAEACVLEDRRCIAIEREEDYLPLIVSRLRKPLQQGLFGLEAGA
ncbi:DNA methyltransferase [Mycobacteroides immunogenum]|uniref:DNA-methyltransferase n=1 Tax=Mycobacteroides immunogenum TaxID=83262 RepID=UPI0025B78872|nr:DNA methyltransferase [Mycobacteroides immunogenum]WJR32452.1 DNA methyltransferase [Mycobacteroides immunogenum]